MYVDAVVVNDRNFKHVVGRIIRNCTARPQTLFNEYPQRCFTREELNENFIFIK